MVFFKEFWYKLFAANENGSCASTFQKMATILMYLLLPVAGLITVWLRKELFSRILIQIDGMDYLPRARVILSYPFLGRSKALIEWAKKRLPPHWSSHLDTLSGGLADFWQDGSLLCTLINSAIPGACSNPYSHWNVPPSHAQDVAYKYLGVEPIFSEEDFNSYFTPKLESKLLNYLVLVYKSIHVLEKEQLLYNIVTPQFVARGMGLYTAEQFKAAEFFIYSRTDLLSLFNTEICITGPYSSCSRTNVLQYLANESKTKSLCKLYESSPKSIDLQVEVQKDRVRVIYRARYCGVHEITLSYDKRSFVGSPYYVNVVNYDVMNQQKCLKINSIQTKQCISYLAKNQRDVGKFSVEATAQDKPLEISRFLKKITDPKLIVSTKSANAWTHCAVYFAEQQYSYFQKFANSCFRTPCNITRASPVFHQKHYTQFSSASPVCSEHIAPEDVRKLSVDMTIKGFTNSKSSHFYRSYADDSSFSLSENSEETTDSPTPTRVVALKENLIEKLTYRKVVKVERLPSRTLRKVVEERKHYFENVFAEESDDTKITSKHSRSTRLKHVDSLYLLRKRPVFKSLTDLRKYNVAPDVHKSFDSNIDKAPRNEECSYDYSDPSGLKKTEDTSSKLAVGFFKVLDLSKRKICIKNRVAPLDDQRVPPKRMQP